MNSQGDTDGPGQQLYIPATNGGLPLAARTPHANNAVSPADGWTRRALQSNAEGDAAEGCA